MAKNNKSKINNNIIIIIAIVVVIAVVFGIYKLNHSNSNLNAGKRPERIEISDSDSKEEKIEKIQKNLEIVNQDIEKTQGKLDTELKKITDLNEEYVGEMKKYQKGVPANEEDMKQAEENMKDYLESQKKAK